MSSQVLHIPRQSDSKVIECFKQVAEEFKIEKVNVNVIGYSSLGAVNLSEGNADLDAVLNANIALINTVSINIGGLTIAYYRGGSETFNGIKKEKSPYFDEVIFGEQNSYAVTLDGADRVRLASFISNELGAFVPGKTIGTESPEKLQLSAIHNETLERLERLNEQLVSSTHNYRNKLDEEFAEKTEKLFNDHEAKHQVLSNQYKEAYDQLEAEKKKLELRRQELNDKDNTHARREIRQDIIKEIKSRQKEFSLTQGTVKLRQPIFYAMIALIMVFALGAGSTGLELTRADLTGAPFYILIAKQAVYTFGAVGSILFFIRWLNRWFEQHSVAEFHLKQFELDMERASWLVETSLEWKDAKGTAMPPELMQSLSTNLFSNRDEVEQVVHPADQLASALLGSASSIKLQAGDSLIEVDPKKLKKQGSTRANA